MVTPARSFAKEEEQVFRNPAASVQRTGGGEGAPGIYTRAGKSGRPNLSYIGNPHSNLRIKVSPAGKLTCSSVSLPCFLSSNNPDAGRRFTSTRTWTGRSLKFTT